MIIMLSLFRLSLVLLAFLIFFIAFSDFQIISGVACIFCGLLQGQTDPDLKNLQVASSPFEVGRCIKQ